MFQQRLKAIRGEWQHPHTITKATLRNGRPAVRIDAADYYDWMRYRLRLGGLRAEIVSGEDRHLIAFECDHQSEAADEVRRLVATHDMGVASDLALDCAERGWLTIRNGRTVLDAIDDFVRDVRGQWELRNELHAHLWRCENARRASEIAEQTAKQDQDATYVPVRTYCY